jgi:hypothetical protein
MERRTAPLGKIEADVCGPLADDDCFGVGETAAIDVDREIAGRQPGERAANAARELIVRRPRADCFANGEGEKVANAQRRGERKRTRAADCDGMEVKRNLDSDHPPVIFCRIEELPAG